MASRLRRRNLKAGNSKTSRSLLAGTCWIILRLKTTITSCPGVIGNLFYCTCTTLTSVLYHKKTRYQKLPNMILYWFRCTPKISKGSECSLTVKHVHSQCSGTAHYKGPVINYQEGGRVNMGRKKITGSPSEDNFFTAPFWICQWVVSGWRRQNVSAWERSKNNILTPPPAPSQHLRKFYWHSH